MTDRQKQLMTPVAKDIGSQQDFALTTQLLRIRMTSVPTEGTAKAEADAHDAKANEGFVAKRKGTAKGDDAEDADSAGSLWPSVLAAVLPLLLKELPTVVSKLKQYFGSDKAPENAVSPTLPPGA